MDTFTWRSKKACMDSRKKASLPTNYSPNVSLSMATMHQTQPIMCSLVVDDFGDKYIGKLHANHLFSTLEEHYEAAIDWEGKLYCGLTLHWDYNARTSYH
jgi:hypothetical protein